VKKETKSCDIYFLHEGDKFEFVHSKQYRDLEVVRVGESGTLIRGAVFDGEKWAFLSRGFTVSNKSRVIPL
jgi:hypothetical protein